MSESGAMSTDMLETILATEKRAVVIDFWSPWCAPCRTLRPHLRRLVEESANAWRLVEVNADDESETAQKFGVRSLPTLVFFRDGTESFRFSGTVPVSTISQKLEELTS